MMACRCCCGGRLESRQGVFGKGIAPTHGQEETFLYTTSGWTGTMRASTPNKRLAKNPHSHVQVRPDDRDREKSFPIDTSLHNLECVPIVCGPRSVLMPRC